MKPYWALYIHVMTLGIILRNMKHMSTYETTLCIINLPVNIRNHIVYYQAICRHIKR